MSVLWNLAAVIGGIFIALVMVPLLAVGLPIAVMTIVDEIRFYRKYKK